jgi:hypothetical protein
MIDRYLKGDAMGGSRALCVGINELVNLPRSNWLYGCVNDANDMASFLQSKLGFGARDVTVLSDAQATKAAVMAKLESMVNLAEQGKVTRIIFAYSSHGTRMPDMSGDEVDRADEALVAYDLAQYGDHWDPNSVIVGLELAALFDRAPEGVLVEVYLDTSHSGDSLTAIDLLPGRLPKFLPPPTPVGHDDVADRSLITKATLDTATWGSPYRGHLHARPRNRPGQVVFMACRPDQIASDADFDGRSNGAFTNFLLHVLEGPSSATRAEVLRATRSELSTASFAQSPQLKASPALRATPVGTMAG